MGLVGRNGEGKSTLFRNIVGEEEYDSGLITTPKDYRIGYLSQHIKFTENTVLKEAVLSQPKNEDGWESTHILEEILQGLGFSPEDMEKPPTQFSGGFQVRLMLAKVLISEPSLILLDEPTNYLDIVSVRFLERFLSRWPNELILITHDRGFMDAVTTHTMGIHRKMGRKIQGPTAQYFEPLALEEEIYSKTRQNQQKRIEHDEKFIERFRAKASKARAVQSRIKSLAKVERLEELSEISSLDFAFRPAPFPGRWLLQAENLSFGFNSDEPPLISNLTFSMGKQDRIGVIGPNGRGKTTLLNLLAGELTPLSGKVGFSENTKIAYFGQTNINRLNLSNTIEQEILFEHPEIGRGGARSICGLMMFEGDSALKKIQVLSGGERSRVLLGKLLVHPSNLLLLDEPTNHLDIESIESLLEALNSFDGGVIIVTHSEMILNAVCNRLVVFDGGKAQLFEGSYQDFLERMGWEEEKNDSSYGPSTKKTEKAPKKSSGLSKKELRAKRAEIHSARSKALNPLRSRVDKIEKEIVSLEAEVEKNNGMLINAIEGLTGAQITELTAKVSKDRAQIEALFSELEKNSNELSLRSKEFEDKLQELGD